MITLNKSEPTKIKNFFNKNGMHYKLMKRSSYWALFKIFTDSGTLAGFEVVKIYKSKKDYTYPNGKILPEGSETISSNEQFGKDGSCSFGKRDYWKAYNIFMDFCFQRNVKKKNSINKSSYYEY